MMKERRSTLSPFHHLPSLAPLRLCGSFLSAIVALTLLAATLTSAANGELRTDALYLPGVNIPIAEISIERIAAGQVIYRDAGGRRHQRNMEDVGSLRFADLPQLDRAEEHVARGEYRQAIPHLLRALVHATNDTQRLWIHARLARAHDIHGEYVQSSSHAAAVFLLEEHIAWRELEPVREPEAEAPFAAVVEARHMLREAQRRISHRDLSQAVVRMLQRIEQIHERMKDADDGLVIQPRTTWSGISIERLRAGEADADELVELEPLPRVDPLAPPERPEPTPPILPRRTVSDPAPEREAPPAAEPRETERDTRSPEAIERLLEQGRFDEALERCRRIERNLSNRDVARFLYQYGRALMGEGELEDAAIMFTRCAILYPSSRYASRSLIETAIIYRDHYRRPQVVTRLLDRAERLLDDDAPAELRERIAQVRSQ